MPMSARSVFSSPEKFMYAQRKKVVFCRKIEEFWRTAVAGAGGDTLAAGKSCSQAGCFSPKIVQTVQVVDFTHQVSRELAAVFPLGQPVA